MCAPSLCSPTLLSARLSSGGCFESSHVTCVMSKHRVPAKRAGGERRGRFADPDLWSAWEGSKQGRASC